MPDGPRSRGGVHSTERTAWGHEARPRHERGGFRGHLARGLHLTWTSLKVLSKNPNLLVLPLLALVLNGFVWLLVALSVWVLGFPPWSPSSDVVYWELFIAYQVTYFLATYFMAAIVAATSARFEGRAPTVADGVRAANGALVRLVAWSLLASTVGVLARLVSLRYEGGGRAIARILGASWPIATTFVLPAALEEDLGPFRAFRRSQALVTERWGPQPGGVLGTGAVFALLALGGLAVFLWGFLSVGGGGLMALGILYLLLLLVLWSVVHGILVTTLYHYALTSEASFGFSWQALNHPWVR